MIDATNKTQIEKITRKIRKQRAFSIQTPEQYLFVHQTLIEYAIKMGKLQTDQDIRQFLFSDAEWGLASLYNIMHVYIHDN
mgnify:CR=1 FL=1